MPMRRAPHVAAMVCAAVLGPRPAGATAAPPPGAVHWLELSGAVRSGTVDHVALALDVATSTGAACLVLAVNADSIDPGALDALIGHLRSARLPVVSYVGGVARAAPTPALLILASTPLSAMHRASSLGRASARAALAMGVVDFVVTEDGDLIEVLDGARIEVDGAARVLATRGAAFYAWPAAEGGTTPPPQDDRASGRRALALVAGLIVAAGLGIVGATLRRPAAAGTAALHGEDGVATTDLGPTRTGQVWIRGELWRARAREPIWVGERVRVTSSRGLELDVERHGG